MDGPGREVREMRNAETTLAIIKDLIAPTGELDDVKISCPVRRGAAETGL